MLYLNQHLLQRFMSMDAPEMHFPTLIITVLYQQTHRFVLTAHRQWVSDPEAAKSVSEQLTRTADCPQVSFLG